MRSGELAHLTGVSTDTLRHYERLGLLPEPVRTKGNYRNYPASSEHRVVLIQRALRIGFSLSELKSILSARENGSAPCRRVRELLGSKVRAMDEQIKTLVSLRADLHYVLKDWDKRLRRTPPGQAVRLLENLPALRRGIACSGGSSNPLPDAPEAIAQRHAAKFNRKKGK